MAESGFFRLPAMPEEERIEEQLLWYEISIGGSARSKRFLENESLELGEEATWTADDIIDREMLAKTETLITRLLEIMDNVGISNRGVGVKHEEALALQAAKEKEELQKVVQGGW